MSRSRFDAVAAQYDAGRPSYPDAMFDALEELAGLQVALARVADVGAGTGIATRALMSRGARVVAVDHGSRMLATLRSRAPDADAVLADANALPFADHSFDLVTFAQSWHWVDFDRAAAEVARVLRPEGALAVWWNTAATGVEAWHDAHRARLRILDEAIVGGRFEDVWQAIPSVFVGRPVLTADLRWQRKISKETMLDEIASKSYVASLGAAEAAAFVERERTLIPDGELIEPFVTRLAVVRMAR
jgi:SAM-dependent methyltransferase